MDSFGNYENDDVNDRLSKKLQNLNIDESFRDDVTWHWIWL